MFKRLAIREGWLTVFLTSMVVFVSVWSIQRADWADGLAILNLITIVGLACGLLLSKNDRVPGIVAFLLAMLAGVLTITWQMTVYLNDSIGSRWEKVKWLGDRAGTWGRTILSGEQAEDLYLFIVFISFLVFFLALMVMWFVFKARWVWAAILFPGMLLLINLGYSLRVPTGYVILYVFFSILLLVRFSLLQRETIWRRLRIEYPNTLAWRGIWAASYLSLLVLIAGWAFPIDARSDRAHELWLNNNGAWERVENQFNQWFTGLRGTGSSGLGGYAAFADSFDLGGPLSLSDDPVVVVNGPGGSPYLTAHRYAFYTGRGWESEFTPSEPAEGEAPREIPPQIELQPGQRIPVDTSNIIERDDATYTVRLERTRGSLLFSPEMFQSADIGVNLVIPWRTVDQALVPIGAPLPPDLPSDLFHVVRLLTDADFNQPEPEPVATPEEATSEPSPESTPEPPPPPAPESAEITAERQLLAERGILVNYTLMYDNEARQYSVSEMRYSGRFPMLADVEAVYARDGLEAGNEYAVNTAVTTALSEELRTAYEANPLVLSDRYLQLSDTVTPRTTTLAQAVTAGTTNPYDAAKAIEAYLRQNIAYSETIEFPPEDVDVVDYVLFESKQGYCEYYASAFVVMMRSLGIPTRMVTGFFPAEMDRDAGGYLYRERNAHAWPEVYFPGYGWIQFEPTANRTEISREPAPPTTTGPNDRTGASPMGGDGLLPDDFELQERGGGFTPVNTSGNQANEAIGTQGWVIRLVTIGSMLAILGLFYLWLRGMRGLSPVSQLHSKVVRGASWSGVKFEPQMTPHEHARALAREVPGSRTSATYLADVYVQEKYSGRQPAQTDVLRARQAWGRLRGLLVRHFFSRLKPWNREHDLESEEDDVW